MGRALAARVSKLLEDGADPVTVLQAWTQCHEKDRESHQMMHLNAMLHHGVEHNNTALVAAVCENREYREFMGRWEMQYSDVGSALYIEGEERDDPPSPMPQDEALCIEWENMYYENVDRDFGFIMEEMNNITPLEAAAKSENVEATKLLINTGYDTCPALKGTTTEFIAKVLLSDKVYRLVQRARNADYLIKTWKENRKQDRFNFVSIRDCREKQELNVMLSVLVLDDNITLLKDICRHPYFRNMGFIYCKYENASPMALAQKRGNQEMVKVLLRAGYQPLNRLGYKRFLVTGDYFLSEKVQALVEEGCSIDSILEVWCEDHGEDHTAAQIEGLNWLIIRGQDRDDKVDYTNTILTHQKFPKIPAHSYMKNSPLLDAVKRRDNELMDVLVRAGYNPCVPFLDYEDEGHDRGFNKYFDDHPDMLFVAVTHQWFRDSDFPTSILEQLVVSGDTNTLHRLVVQHQVKMRHPIFLVQTACMVGKPETLDTILTWNIISVDELNETRPRVSFPNICPAFVLGDEWFPQSLKVLLKHGLNPLVMTDKEGTILAKLCIWFRETEYEVDWSETLDLIEYFLDVDADVDLSVPGKWWLGPQCPLQSFAAIKPSVMKDHPRYESLFTRLAERSPAKVRNATLTSIILAICFTMSCDEDNFLEGEGHILLDPQLDLLELCVCNADLVPDVEHVKQLHNRAMILIKLGTIWDDGYYVPVNLVKILYRLHKDNSSFDEHDEDDIMHHKQCVSYLARLLPFVVRHLIDSKVTVIVCTDLLIDLLKFEDTFLPILHIFLDFVSPPEFRWILLDTMMNQLDHIEDRQKMYIMEEFRKCQQVKTLKEIARSRVNLILVSKNQLHKVKELELPLVLEDYLLYRQ